MSVVSAVFSSALAGHSGPDRFAPNEIIVKFRGPLGLNGCGEGPLVEGSLPRAHGMQILQGRYHVREIKPLLKDFDRRLASLRPTRARDRSRPIHRQRYLQRHKHGATSSQSPDPGRTYRVKLALQPGQSLDEVLAAYRSRPDVEYAERNPRISICAVPDDPRYTEQWSLTKIRAADVWDTCRGSNDVVVAVIDTGVDYHHRDLQGNLWVNEAELNGIADVDDDHNGYIDDIRGYNFAYNDADPADDHGHGTHCAGIIAAAGDNGLDVAGICWTARIMSLKVLGADGDGSAADAVPAIYYAVVNGADIISGSWGGEEPSEAIREAVEYARREGVVVVAAAGNEDSDVPFYPAAYPPVIAVAATESSDGRWRLSNYGDWVDIAAPGQDILSLRATGTSRGVAQDDFTGRLSGTSMAAPHVAGACALLLAANPLLTCDELEQILFTTADSITPGICASNGRLNLYEALRGTIPPEGTIRLDHAYYAEGADIGVLLADWDLRGAAYHVVLMEAGSGDQEMVTLMETDVSLGVFRGVMASNSAVANPDDGILQVRDGENITVRYIDGVDDRAQGERWRQAGAVADYEPPALWDLQIEASGRKALIELTTSEPTRVQVRFGRNYGGPYDWVKNSDELSDRHEIELRGLASQTRYWFVVALTDAAGNEALADGGGQGYEFIVQGRFPGVRVPAAYPTIQAAVDDAQDGDIVWVGDGTYSGQGNIEIDFLGKAITVRSENGPALCTIDCQGQGRAFHFHNGETPASVLEGFTITNGGSVDYGGGIRCVGSSPTIRNCVLLKNAAEQYGGGLCNCYGSHPTVVNCTFEENSCSSSGLLFGRGGGMANRQGSSPTVSDCTFVGNSARHSAGGLGSYDGSSPRVSDCTFNGNSTGSSGGAAGNWDDSRPVFERCIFTRNRAEDDGGAVVNTNGSKATFANCILSGNVADGFGGAIKNHAGTIVLANCTVGGNHAEWSCGGIWNTGASGMRLDNCILWGNTDSGSAEQVEAAQIGAGRGGADIRYCDVQGWSGALGGIGNFGLEPLFVDADGEDFHLQSNSWRWDAVRERWTYDAVTSPCIDAGNPGWLLGDEPLSVPDDPNGTLAANKRINMGAYGGTAEASLAPSHGTLLADTNNDRAVDWLDLAHLTTAWMQAGSRRETDLSRDGLTGTADLILLAREWRHKAEPPAVQAIPAEDDGAPMRLASTVE